MEEKNNTKRTVTKEEAVKNKIAGAGSLDIQNCKIYWELVTSNFELTFLLNFLEILKKVIKKEPIDLDKRKKY